jgi:hypothetical protein
MAATYVVDASVAIKRFLLWKQKQIRELEERENLRSDS